MLLQDCSLLILLLQMTISTLSARSCEQGCPLHLSLPRIHAQNKDKQYHAETKLVSPSPPLLKEGQEASMKVAI